MRRNASFPGVSDASPCSRCVASAPSQRVRIASRKSGLDTWVGPNRLLAQFGREAAHAEWFYGFRLAARIDLGSRLLRAWTIVPGTINKRDVAPGLIERTHYLAGLLAHKGFNGK